MKWLHRPVPVAVMSRIGRYLPYEVAVLARIAGHYEPYLAVICCTKWLLWPVSLAVMSRVGRYLPYGVALLARIAGRHEPRWPCFAARSSCSGPYRRPV